MPFSFDPQRFGKLTVERVGEGLGTFSFLSPGLMQSLLTLIKGKVKHIAREALHPRIIWPEWSLVLSQTFPPANLHSLDSGTGRNRREINASSVYRVRY